VCPSVHLVAKEQLVEALDVTVFRRAAIEVEEAHQVDLLAVDVAKNLDGCAQAQHHGLLLDDFLGFIA
jgi:hypothetical protein